MTNTSKLQYKIKPIPALDDQAITNQIPIEVLARLGTLEESGYHLLLNRRD